MRPSQPLIIGGYMQRMFNKRHEPNGKRVFLRLQSLHAMMISRASGVALMIGIYAVWCFVVLVLVPIR